MQADHYRVISTSQEHCPLYRYHFTDLEVKVDALFSAPLVIRKTALAAFGDKSDLVRFSNTVSMHNDCSL